MTGSAHDGEALNAARLADALVRERGITWADVLAVPALASPYPAQAPQPSPSLDLLRDWPAHWRMAASVCVAYGSGLIRAKDLDFANKIVGYGHRPSEAQLIWLHDITQRVLAGGVS